MLMGDCRNLSICSNVQITKYLDVSNLRQIPSKSQNLWFFCQNLEKSRHVRTGCFLSKFRFYSAKLPNIQVYCIHHVHTLGDRSRQSICWRHISLDIWVRERVTECKLRRIFSSIFTKISINLLKMRGWNESGTIWMNNNYGTKLREDLPNRHQIRSKKEIWKVIFEHLNRF